LRLVIHKMPWHWGYILHIAPLCQLWILSATPVSADLFETGSADALVCMDSFTPV